MRNPVHVKISSAPDWPLIESSRYSSLRRELQSTEKLLREAAESGVPTPVMATQQFYMAIGTTLSKAVDAGMFEALSKKRAHFDPDNSWIENQVPYNDLVAHVVKSSAHLFSVADSSSENLERWQKFAAKGETPFHPDDQSRCLAAICRKLDLRVQELEALEFAGESLKSSAVVTHSNADGDMIRVSAAAQMFRVGQPQISRLATSNKIVTNGETGRKRLVSIRSLARYFENDPPVGQSLQETSAQVRNESLRNSRDS